MSDFGVFAELRIVTVCLIFSVCLFVRPPATAWLSLEGFS